MSAPRGLTNFIRDIRNCASKEDERKRVNLELANIRTKFKQSDKLSSYDRKKCVARACVPPQRAAPTCPAPSHRPRPLSGPLTRVPSPCARPGMSGSCCTSTCWATRLSSDTWRRVVVSLLAGGRASARLCDGGK